ncbi:phage holin family protein [Metasolibacillus sp.]|uniref:phage holin family protein n=1 Tax=Metasolibacillus sp. TaxID=2703680 RepID=UPI0025D3B608|nr:phage holin family protein [Metasolibacillus sp.]MCT6924116.1 phage holin family protein [Metasolibacillus sp.]MCT6940223.1 phage holin family protein [Metasolibacillus sp.]
MEGINLEYLDVAHLYLFGGVKFIDLLLLLMTLDIVTGLFKAWKNGNLWSRKSLFGYARKLLVLIVIITANIIDQVLSLGGTLTFATVLFYVANEALSITENMAQLGVLVPQNLAEKLKVIEATKHEKDHLVSEIAQELAGKGVDKKLKDGEGK